MPSTDETVAKNFHFSRVPLALIRRVRAHAAGTGQEQREWIIDACRAELARLSDSAGPPAGAPETPDADTSGPFVDRIYVTKMPNELARALRIAAAMEGREIRFILVRALEYHLARLTAGG